MSWNSATQAMLRRTRCSFTLRRLPSFGTGRTETTIGQVQFAEDFIATAAFCCPSVILHAVTSPIDDRECPIFNERQHVIIIYEFTHLGHSL
jgi:hypothetical protein